MTTKRELVQEINNIALDKIGNNSLDFSNYMRLNKAELENRLIIAREMIGLEHQRREIKGRYTDNQWNAYFMGYKESGISIETGTKMLEISKETEKLWHMI